MNFRFKILYGELIRKKIIYRKNECSFDTVQSNTNINYELVLNSVVLTIVSDNNIIEQLFGFCCVDLNSNDDIFPPINSKKGKIVVDNDQELSGSYRISNELFPISYGKNNWFCIGR